MKLSRFTLFALSMMIVAGTAWGQATTVTKSRSNVKDNLKIIPTDGTVASAQASPEVALPANIQIVKSR